RDCWEVSGAKAVILKDFRLRLRGVTRDFGTTDRASRKGDGKPGTHDFPPKEWNEDCLRRIDAGGLGGIREVAFCRDHQPVRVRQATPGGGVSIRCHQPTKDRSDTTSAP